MNAADEAVLDRARAAIDRYDPDARAPVTASVRAQIVYLTDLLQGRGNPKRLDDIILGVQAAKEFDGYPEIADPLHEAAAIARRLKDENNARLRRDRTHTLLRRLFGTQEQNRS